MPFGGHPHTTSSSSSSQREEGRRTKNYLTIADTVMVLRTQMSGEGVNNCCKNADVEVLCGWSLCAAG